jgi:hypothetical protein
LSSESTARSLARVSASTAARKKRVRHSVTEKVQAA